MYRLIISAVFLNVAMAIIHPVCRIACTDAILKSCPELQCGPNESPQHKPNTCDCCKECLPNKVHPVCEYVCTPEELKKCPKLQCGPNESPQRNPNTCDCCNECLPNKEPTTTCGKNEVYTDCGTACPRTCKNLRVDNDACTAECVAGCFCKKGLVRNDDGECVNPDQCPNQVHPVCLYVCTPEELKNCPKLKCGPNESPQRNPDTCDCCNECLPNKEPTTTCGKNEVYTDCGTACPRTCKNLRVDNDVCTTECVSGCFCKKGLVRNDDGECVNPDQCPNQPDDCQTDCSRYHCPFIPVKCPEGEELVTPKCKCCPSCQKIKVHPVCDFVCTPAELKKCPKLKCGPNESPQRNPDTCDCCNECLPNKGFVHPVCKFVCTPAIVKKCPKLHCGPNESPQHNPNTCSCCQECLPNKESDICEDYVSEDYDSEDYESEEYEEDW